MIHAKYKSSPAAFNMTPLIDIIFLLIIFFLVVYQFIEPRTLPVNLPRQCTFASQLPDDLSSATITVLLSDNRPDYLVNSIPIESQTDPVEQMTSLINSSLKSSQLPVVTLRIDRKTPFKHAKHALDAIAQSCASRIQLSTLKADR